MVNTRRKESTRSAPDPQIPRYKTRRNNEDLGQEGEEEEEEDGHEEENRFEPSIIELDSADDSEFDNRKLKDIREDIVLKNSRVRELRSRFVCDDRKFSPNPYTRRHEHKLKPNRKVIVNERRSLTVFRSSRKMCDDMSEGYSPSPRAHRSHHDRHKQRRTALSLRPITRKSYNLYLSEDSDLNEHVHVRRSSRNTRNRRNYNMSWLGDEQMPKVGYPNVRTQEYFEEDSRDAEVEDNSQSANHSKIDSNYINGDSAPPSTSATNNSRPSRYLQQHDKENKEATLNTPSSSSPPPVTVNTHGKTTTTNTSTASTSRLKTRSSSSGVSARVEGEKEVAGGSGGGGGGGRVRRRAAVATASVVVETRRGKGEEEEEDDDDNDDDNDDDKDEDSDEEEEEDKDEKEESKATGTKNVSEFKLSGGSRTGNIQNISIKTLGSTTSSETSRKGYSLRKRVNKLCSSIPRVISRKMMPDRRARHYPGRREPSRARSSSSSSSDSEENYRKSNKYNKNAKSPHKAEKSSAGNSKLVPIRPEQMDGSVKFSSVGGLDSHVQCLKEMVLLPMMYPEVFQRFQIQPPRGVLFHGPPGTGKTLIARALANECSFGSRKVAFFMRKGADLLSKWVGESEKQLRMLFDRAAEMKPSIIFFDELDGLAPVRSSRQDQFHASIVSTLLALMDGLDNRGEVIVIGATNRIDAIDPALRRPGRFDRELYFPLPARKEREEILKVHVSKWETPPSDKLMSYLAEGSIGYCGSDLRALCSEAVIQSFRRIYPQVYTADHRLTLDPESVKVERIDFLRAKSMLTPASHRVSQNLGRKLLPVLVPLFQQPLADIIKILEKTFPHGTNPTLAKVRLSAGVKPAQLLLVGNGPECGQTTHLSPALLQYMEHVHTHILDLASLHRQTGISSEEACIQVFQEAKRTVPSIIYIPSINSFWELISETVQAIFTSQVAAMEPNLPVLILATADSVYSTISPQLQQMFSLYRHEVYHLTPPSTRQRLDFYRPLLLEAAVRPPRPSRLLHVTAPLVLERAPTPALPPLSPTAEIRMFEGEERTLRELRIFLRDMCKKLANNRLFFIFTKPVDTEEVPDYPTIIKEPMDLETMMTKVDLHSYQCAKDFLADIDLICQNALEYNPAKTSADKQIRHRACSLRDYAFTLIKNEMDSDFEDKCQDIAKKRRDRKASVAQYLPPYLHTEQPNREQKDCQSPKEAETQQNTSTAVVTATAAATATATNTSIQRNSPHRKRRIPSWQRGYLSSKKKKRSSRQVDVNSISIEDVTQEKSSGEESKENHPVIDDSMDTTILDDSHAVIPPPTENCTTLLEIKIDTSIAAPIITVNSDTASVHGMLGVNSPLQSPSCKRQLSELLSPSELLNDHLEFDDIDQALNETVCNNTPQQLVNVSKEELEALLEKVVESTKYHSVQVILDLHHQLCRIIKMYSATFNRIRLPQDLRKELLRFESEAEITET